MIRDLGEAGKAREGGVFVANYVGPGQLYFAALGGLQIGCRTGFATPSETFAGGDPENIPDGVANPVRQKAAYL
ncbi:Uncharacterized protein dnm_070650 [Desulfonema magnum]|uniref:Uncharacterized protein n=1 Tax=Desulfonema magnum TaxID=45655 RepID=A0A975GRF5_9BACT|nr:Uncharacterized protein dnm_070650 [Desulfonema magnum]